MYAEFEKLGLPEVRARLASKKYLGPTASLNAEWLARKETESADETMSLARDSNQLARLASTEAQKANRIALAAILIALASKIIAAVGTFHGWK